MLRLSPSCLLWLLAGCSPSGDSFDGPPAPLDAGRDYSFSHCVSTTPQTDLVEVPCTTALSGYCFAEIPNPFF